MYRRFEKLLAERNISAYRVAKDTGIPQPFFSEWKKGKYNPGAERLLVLAKYFGVPMEYFLEQDAPQAGKDENAAAQQLVWMTRGLDDYDLQRMYDFAAGIRAGHKLEKTG